MVSNLAGDLLFDFKLCEILSYRVFDLSEESFLPPSHQSPNFCVVRDNEQKCLKGQHIIAVEFSKCFL